MALKIEYLDHALVHDDPTSGITQNDMSHIYNESIDEVIVLKKNMYLRNENDENLWAIFWNAQELGCASLS